LPRDAEQGRVAQRVPRLAAGICLFAACLASASLAREPDVPSDPCRRPEAGSAVAEPQDLRSADGILKVDLAFYNSNSPMARPLLPRDAGRRAVADFAG
jgi:hypothetical protein